jgi:ankyrin repeat protein
MKLQLAVLVAGFASASALATEATLLDAVEQRNRGLALELLAAGSDVRERGADGTTALMWAAHHGDLELVERLIRAGADVTAVNEFGASALLEAAAIGSAPIVDALLDAGADPNSANQERETPLMVVARTGKVEAASRLIDAGADVNAKEEWGGQSALMWAAAQSQPEMVALLVANGAEVDARGAIRNWQRKVITEPRPKDMNRGGFTALLYAAREGCVECAKHLLDGGADPNLADPERVTPLNLALMNLHFDFAVFMIEAGADVDRWDFFGRTPLYMAVDVNSLPTQGNGAMQYIPSLDTARALDVVRLLLEKGANPNIQLKRRPPYLNVPQDRGGDTILSQGATPLLRAARAGDAAAVELLLQHGALVDLPSAYGVTPLMAAAGVEYGLRVTRGRHRTEEGVLATLQLLIDAGADVEARMLTEENSGLVYQGASRRADFSYNSRGRQIPGPAATPHRTALHGAALKGFNSVVELLVANGADLHAKDANGRTPIELAMGRYEEDFLRQAAEPHVETVALLERLMAAAPSAEGSSGSQ